MHNYILCKAIHQKTQLSRYTLEGISKLHSVILAVSVKTRSKSKQLEAGAETVTSSGI